MKELYRNVGEMNYDGLVTDIIPPVQVRGGTIASTGTATIYKRGTVFAKDEADGKLYLLGASGGGTTHADCILCDDTEVGTEDVVATVYTAGCFDPDKITVAESYTMSVAVTDKLRERGIVFKAASPAN